LKIAEEAKSKLLRKKADAEILLFDVREAEKAVNASKTAADSAEKSSMEAKKIGEEAAQNITTLIKDIREFLGEKFRFPNESKALALETLTKNISLTPEEARNLAKQINQTASELRGVDEILEKSKENHTIALNLKEEALKARDYALAIMNKTERILGMLSKAAELRNSTAQVIGVARLNIDELLKLIEQIKEKQAIVDKDLTEASGSVDSLESKRDEVKSLFDENKRKLPEAEREAEKAEDLAKQVNETSNKLETKYGTVQKKLREKQEEIGNIRERLQKLSDGAIALFQKALVKLELIKELKKKYNRNEERVKDLMDELKRLEILVGSSKEKLVELSKCHANCNPFILGKICQTQLNSLETKQKNALDTHDAMVKNRKQASES